LANKIEIGFDLSGLPDAEFAKLDDAFYGILDASQTVLGGAIYLEVTPSVITYSINRGKSRQLDRYQAGTLAVDLDNNTRIFDPLFVDSPYYTQVIPKRAIRVTSNDVVQYQGLIDDWNLSYSPNGNSIASITASDAFAQFANQQLAETYTDAEYTGERIAAVLQNAGMLFPSNQIIAEDGLQYLQDDVIAEDTKALQYLQTIADCEPGVLFVSKSGQVVFKDRYAETTGTPTFFSDDGTGFSYQSIGVTYGSELLYNDVEITVTGGGTETAVNAASQEEYGIAKLVIGTLPLDSEQSAQNLATYLVSQYSEPEYRFESLAVEVSPLTLADQTEILELELGDFVRVKFTPNNLPPAIDRYVEIIGISQSITGTTHNVTFSLASAEYNFWRLSDLVFGKLGTGNALAY